MSHSTQALGLRFRLRHLLIVVTYFAILLGILVPVLWQLRSLGLVNPALVILVVSPWLLGLLVLVVERRGPVKYWAAPLLLSLTSPALAAAHDWVIVDNWRQTGVIPNALVTLTLNAVLIGSFSVFFLSMLPDSCPRCGHRSLIPLLHFWGRARRTPTTRWCGSCGAQYWRARNGVWQKERRATWIDSIAKDNSAPRSPHVASEVGAAPSEAGAAAPEAAEPTAIGQPHAAPRSQAPRETQAS
jgi:hypothetical protein